MPENVLITGGAGFIGSSLTRRLVDAGHRVTILDSLVAQVHGDEPSETSPLLKSVSGIADVHVGTVTSTDDLRAALVDATVVVHLAAETGTGQSMYEIDRYVETNVGGTGKLLDLLANEPHTVRRIVIASSRSVYGEGAYLTADGTTVFPPHRSSAAMEAGDFDVHMTGGDALTLIPTPETALLHPSSVYGITKQSQEALIMTAAPSIGVESVALRYQNVYGPGQSLKNPYTGILSIFSTLIRQGKSINIFEDGLESRDFVYIDDVVEATFRACVDPRAAGHTFNVGSGVKTTVRDVVDALFRAFGIEVPVTISGNFRLGDIRHNVADTSRIQETLGFTAAVPFDAGIRRFAEWVLTQPLETDGYERSLAEMAERKLLK
ncbi:NAD-dependent epimerase/dehydratase family protein [Microbacterium saccharophilum]|uniref:NAD-dependent epimerase/dehydratase family protein n=1 Tax=Microbacterium saccharophilum TaxID=1213358 RepID=A0A5C8I889_9MICO|nr:NAD-dependent epimerase/dehydratase family protein [Microbacterium saccharophilum]GEP47941.1 nucleoside-diphosphate-sugar epimerase [Microbacterium saccharophilum]